MMINSIEKIAIIGAGWLGSQIRDSFLAMGKDVISTHTSQRDDENSKVLHFPTSDYSSVTDADLYIINIPPSKIQVEDLKKFRAFFNDRSFIFISSTSVFDRLQGTVSEETPPLAITERGIKNIALEKIFEKDCIIRCGGLIGPGRHPIKSLQMKTIEGEQLINLIHSEDIIEIIKLALEKNYKGIIHASFQSKMTKKDYYTEYAQKYNYGVPSFSDQENVDLEIDSVVLREWNYKFKNNLF